MIQFLQRRRFAFDTLLAYPVSYWAEVVIQERAMTLPYQVYTTQSLLRHPGLTTLTAKRICRRLRHLDLLDRQEAMYWAIHWCYVESYYTMFS